MGRPTANYDTFRWAPLFLINLTCSDSSSIRDLRKTKRRVRSQATACIWSIIFLSIWLLSPYRKTIQTNHTVSTKNFNAFATLCSLLCIHSYFFHLWHFSSIHNRDANIPRIYTQVAQEFYVHSQVGGPVPSFP